MTDTRYWDCPNCGPTSIVFSSLDAPAFCQKCGLKLDDGLEEESHGLRERIEHIFLKIERYDFILAVIIDSILILIWVYFLFFWGS